MLMARANLDKAPSERGLEEYPQDWQEDFQRLSTLVLDLSARYESNLFIRIYDPRSLQGLIKSLRYGVHRYPTFVVMGKEKVAGWDMARLEKLIQAAGAIATAQVEIHHETA
jgi:hypothetical protein